MTGAAGSPETAGAAGPASEEASNRFSGEASGRSRLFLALVAVLAIVITSAIAFSIGRLSTLADPAPTTTSAEAGFARDMQVHHDQGAQLAMIVRDLSPSDDVRTLAYDIVITQTQQSGQLYGWLAQWGLPQAASEPSMTWMTLPTLQGTGHTHSGGGTAPSAHKPGGRMPGLATDAQIAQLRRAPTSAEAERIFLTLMIAHHHGAVEMAEAVEARTTDTHVLAFAKGVIASQNSEIELMTGMLDERGGPIALA